MAKNPFYYHVDPAQAVKQATESINFLTADLTCKVIAAVAKSGKVYAPGEHGDASWFLVDHPEFIPAGIRSRFVDEAVNAKDAWQWADFLNDCALACEIVDQVGEILWISGEESRKYELKNAKARLRKFEKRLERKRERKEK